MDSTTVTTALVAVAVIGLLVLRQLRWRVLDPAGALRLPVVLAAIGVLQLAQLRSARITAVDAAFLAIELLLSVGIGAAMGRLAAFRTAPDGSGRTQVRGGPLAASLWIVLIGVRLGFDALGGVLGAHLLTQTGVILILIAASRATSALVVRTREPRSALQSA